MLTGSDTLGALGEAAVLARILARLSPAVAADLGPGDDAAVVRFPDGRGVITTDFMVHGPDFRLAWSTPFDLGWKAAATNLSDVAAMGATPSALVVGLAAPADTPVTVLEGIAEGLDACCRALAPGCGVVGGDLSVSATLTIAVTAFGDLGGRTPVLRSGARAGDIVAVAGALGLAGAGLSLLFQQAMDADGVPDATAVGELRRAHPLELAAQLAPTPPIGLGTVAADAGATAMMDVSDGLSLDAGRMARASGVTIALERDALGAHPLLALTGGEDHALLATFPPEVALPEGFARIGDVLAGEPVILVDGEPFEPTGWDPYARWDGAEG